VISEIYQRNKGEFGSEEEIFKTFAKAVLTGRLMELARLIDNTYGKGSFRKLGISSMSEAAGMDS